MEGKLPKNIYTEYMDDLVHDFVVHVEMVKPVVDFICRCIGQGVIGTSSLADHNSELLDLPLRSKL